MVKQKLIIWDFDGVLFDSLTECAIVLHISLKILNKEKNIEINKITKEKNNDEKDIKKILEKIRPLRPFIINGQDYIWQYLNHEKFNFKTINHNNYQKIFNSIFDKKKDTLYNFAFYESRKLLQNALKDDYYKLFSPYKQAINALKKSIFINKNYVCSARDSLAINFLFNYYGINLNKNNIYAKETHLLNSKINLSKKEQILEILKKEGFLNKEFYLIEDQINLPLSLIKKFSKIKIIYAKYGYGLEEECNIFNNKAIDFVEEDKEIMEKVLL